MKLFLDDIRKGPSGYQVFRSVGDIRLMIDMFHSDVEVLSIDYDLGGGQTTMDLLLYIEEKGYDIPWINIHSTHDEGVPRLQKFCEEHLPGTKVTTNKVD